MLAGDVVDLSGEVGIELMVLQLRQKVKFLSYNAENTYYVSPVALLLQ